MTPAQKIAIYGLVLAAVSIIFIAVSIGIPVWQSKSEIVSKYIYTDAYAGLWKLCNKTTVSSTTTTADSETVTTTVILNSQCFDIKEISAQDVVKFISAIRYLLFGALGCMVVAVLGILIKVCLFTEWVHETQQKALGYITALLALLSGCLVIAAFSVFHVELRYDGFTLHVGFYFSILAWLLSWVTAATFLAGGLCIGAKMSENQYGHDTS